MKIAYLYDAVYPYVKGGVERRISEIGRRLTERGHDVHQFCGKYWSGDPKVNANGVTLHGIAPGRTLYRGGRRYPRQAVEFGARLFAPLCRERFDLIDCQQFPYLSAFPGAFAAKLHRSAFVVTWHEVWGHYWYEYLGYRGIAGAGIEKVVARLRSSRVAVSMQTKEDLEVLTGGQPIELIPNGIDVEYIRTVQPAAEGAEVMFAGRLIREKHVDTLVEAIGILARQDPGIRCTIVGEGPEKSALMAKTEESGLEQNITFTGFLEYPAMIGLMKSSKVFAFPSSREGFGMAVLEALACGLPVVTLDVRSNASRHLVEEGVTGAWCRADPIDLAEKIVRCSEGKSRMEAACKAFAAGYDWEAIAERTESFYRGCQDSK